MDAAETVERVDAMEVDVAGGIVSGLAIGIGDRHGDRPFDSPGACRCGDAQRGAVDVGRRDVEDLSEANAGPRLEIRSLDGDGLAARRRARCRLDRSDAGRRCDRVHPQAWGKERTKQQERWYE